MSDFFGEPPPGFRGLDPQLPVRIYERHLPHWRQDGAVYFITFRLADSLPQSKLAELAELRAAWERAHPEPRADDTWRALSREITQRVEHWLDQGMGACPLAVPALARMVADALLHFQGARCAVFCHAVMPNHCHVVARPLGEWELEEILKSWKGFTARKLNVALGRKGALWQEESHDRIVRDTEHLWKIVQYIGRNPMNAGLPRERWVRWLHPEWERFGWRFEGAQS